jgi:ferritin-like metal-binding protein YciE
MRTLADLHEHMLRDAYHAEKQVNKLLPKLIRAVSDETLKEMLTEDRAHVVERAEALEAGFEAIGKRPRGVPCEAMAGLVEEASEVIDDAEEEAVNAGVLAAYQAIKHYEITRFGTLAAWSKRLGHGETAARFSAVVSHCKELDERLSELAETEVNPEADGDGAGAASAAMSGGKTRAKAKAKAG